MTVHNGIIVNEIATSGTQVNTASSAVIGIIVTASDADAVLFPFDTPVLITNINAAILESGTEGTMSNVLKSIADQTNPDSIILVRVEHEENELPIDADLTAAIDKFTLAQNLFGIKPDYIAAPGLETAAVINKLVTVADKLDAYSYVGLQGLTENAAVAFKSSLTGNGKLTGIWPDWSDYKGSAVAVALGLRAKLTQTIGPHQSLGNNPVNNVSGISIPVEFDISGLSGTAKYLNDNNITTLVYFDGSYRYWGNRTLSAESPFVFETGVLISKKIKKIIQLELARYLSKPLTPSFIKNRLANINNVLRSMKADGEIIDGRAWFDPNANPATKLNTGAWELDFEYTAPAPAESGEINQRVTDKYYSNFAKALEV